MLLSNIIDLICPKKIKFYEKNKNVEYITANSKLVKKNSIYIADFKKKIKNTYFKEAINNGAVAILTNKTISNLKIPQLIVENLQTAINLILHSLKPFPPNNIIGITGTNGKTSVVWLVSSILKLSKLNVKSLGTLGYYENLVELVEVEDALSLGDIDKDGLDEIITIENGNIIVSNYSDDNFYTTYTNGFPVYGG